jgi:hypothetical protein
VERFISYRLAIRLLVFRYDGAYPEERPLAGISQSAVLIYPGEQPIFVEDLDEVLRVPELVAGLQLTLGVLWGWMKIGE